MRLFIKLTGIAVIVLSCSLLGFIKSFLKKENILDLEKVGDALTRADNMLRLGTGDRKTILSASFADVQGFCTHETGTNFSFNSRNNFLSKCITEFFNEFGRGDVELERQRIERVKLEINEELEKEKNTYASSCRIWRISGVCIGLTIGIMFI